MSITHPRIHLPHWDAPSGPSRFAATFWWLAAAVAVVVVGALVWAALDSDSSTAVGGGAGAVTSTGTDHVGPGLLEHGSIAAIDHADAGR